MATTQSAVLHGPKQDQAPPLYLTDSATPEATELCSAPIRSRGGSRDLLLHRSTRCSPRALHEMFDCLATDPQRQLNFCPTVQGLVEIPVKIKPRNTTRGSVNISVSRIRYTANRLTERPLTARAIRYRAPSSARSSPGGVRFCQRSHRRWICK